MSIVLNLGMSHTSSYAISFAFSMGRLSLTPCLANWQMILLPTMRFLGEMLVDYVRVYQRKGAVNVGCDPEEYPTRRYIEEHMDAYQS
ncbi:SKN1-domain-containing protein, partial [Coprinopsis marcescibilis]